MDTSRLSQEVWHRLPEDLRRSLAELAILKSSMSEGMRRHIGACHLGELLNTVNDVDELNQK